MSTAPLTRLRLENFTCFAELDIEFCPGVNVFIGPNGTGKTHILKVLYDACAITRPQAEGAPREYLREKLRRDFLPAGNDLSRLARVSEGRPRRQDFPRNASSAPFDGDGCDASVLVESGARRLEVLFVVTDGLVYPLNTPSDPQWATGPIECTYVPPKDTLANAPGLMSLYQRREMPVEELYIDLISQVELLPLRTLDEPRGVVLTALEATIEGRVFAVGEEFFLRQGHAEIEFPLLAEGARKLGLLTVLIRNGCIAEGSALFWDEPEANLHPRFVSVLVNALFDLSQLGTQMFLATHSYNALKKLELLARQADVEVRVFSLSLPPDADGVAAVTADLRNGMPPNEIVRAELDLDDEEVGLELTGRGPRR